MPSKFQAKFKVTSGESRRQTSKPLAEQTGRFELNAMTVDLPTSSSTPRQSDSRAGQSGGKRHWVDGDTEDIHDLPQSLVNPMFEDMENQTYTKTQPAPPHHATYRNFKHLDEISLRESSDFCEPAPDSIDPSFTTENGLHSFLGTRTFGISTLELVDLGLAGTGSFDARSPTPFTLTNLPRSPCPNASVKKNSPWQAFLILMCLFWDVETLIGTSLKMFHHGRLAFFSIYIGTLLTVVFPLAFTHCLIGQSQSGHWTTALSIKPLGQGLVHAIVLVSAILGNQKMIHCVHSIQTAVLGITQGSMSSFCHECEDGWMLTNPNASSTCPISDATANHSGLESGACFTDQFDPFDAQWSERVHGNPMITSGSFVFTLLVVSCFLYLGFSVFRRALPLILSVVATLLLIVFIRVGSNMNRSDFALVFEIPWPSFGKAKTWIMAGQSAINTGVLLSGLLYFTSSHNLRNHAFPSQLMGCIGIHTLVMILAYVIVGGVFVTRGRDGTPFEMPHLLKFLYFDLPEYFFQFEIPQVWRVCYALLVFLIELIALIILGMCLTSVWQKKANRIPIMSMPVVRSGLICLSLVILCIPEVIVPSIGLSQMMQLLMEKYVQETLILLQIWLLGRYGLVQLVSIQKLSLGYSCNKFVALSAILFIASVTLSLMIYDVSGFATPSNLLLINPWITSGGGLIAILIVLVSACPCILAMVKAKFQGRPIRDVFAPVTPLNQRPDCQNSSRTRPRVLLQKSDDHFRA
ncbi:uncharacterized protein LOC131890817 [Tigriopus californicus]|uniref:uncharacterized protein LOC131890817 n=1 Tax=Tigriopus californicus TaxID=6832 RepID=UPI0027D9E947|nr:uncharacterized protein LOC131890817 [Tigriopus californicus]